MQPLLLTRYAQACLIKIPDRGPYQLGPHMVFQPVYTCIEAGLS